MQPNHLRGIAYIVAGFLAISLMDAVAKWRIMEGLPVVQLLAIRGWLTLPLLLLIEQLHGDSRLTTQRWGAQLLRGLLGGVLTPLLFFSGIKVLPLAEATALVFTSAFVMVVLSGVFLREPVGRHRGLAVAVGFAGVLLITRPGAEIFVLEAAFVLGASVSYAASNVIGRWLSATESTASLVFYLNLAMAVVMTLALPWYWQPLTGTDVIGLLGITVLGLLGHIGIVLAFKSTPVALIAPFEYSALIWATLLGVTVFGDLPDSLSFGGMAVILGSGVYLMLCERNKAGQSC